MSLLLEMFQSKFKKVTFWDNAAVKKCKDEFGRDALMNHNADIHEIWPKARCHKVDCSRIKYVVVCSTWNELFILQVHGFISNVAVRMGSLSPLFVVEDFINAQGDYAATHVAEELFAAKREARTITQNFLEELDEDERDGPRFVKMLQTKKQILKGADPHWMVVHSFFASQSEENSDSKFAQRLLECLPTEEKPVTWAQAESDLKELHAAPLGRYAGRAICSHLRACSAQ